MINIYVKNLSVGAVIIAMLYFSEQKCTSDLIKYSVWAISAVVFICYFIHHLYNSIKEKVIKENQSMLEQSKVIQELNTRQMNFVKNQQEDTFLARGNSAMPSKTDS